MSNSYNSPDQYIPSQNRPGEIPPPHGEPWSPISGRAVRWCVVIGTVALVLGPLLFQLAPHEIARWHAAAAHGYRERKDDEGVKRELDAALKWDPKCAEALSLQAFLETERLLAKEDREGALKAAE